MEVSSFLFSSLVMLVFTNVRAVFFALAGEFRGVRTDETMPHPGDTRPYTHSKKLKAYFYQILEMVNPSMFFPRNYGLPLDRFDQDRLFPATRDHHQAQLLDALKLVSKSSDEWKRMLSDEYDVGRSLEYLQWGYSVFSGVTPRQRFITAFPDSQSRNSMSKATVWEELKDGQLDKRTMGAGIFIVGGTLAETLGLGAHPQHVSRIRLAWEERCLAVVWYTESTVLWSLWPLGDAIIFTGVAD